MNQIGPLVLFDYGRTRHATSTVTTVRDGQLITLTFAQVADRARRLAAALAASGVRTGDVIATCCRNHHEHLEVMFASHLLGTCFAPLNSRADDAALAAMLGQISPRVVVADPATAPRLEPQLGPGVVTVGIGVVDGWRPYEELLAEGETATWAAPDALDEQGLATVLFTGGTTGVPKGASYTRRALYLHTTAWGSPLGIPITGDDTVLILVATFHGLGWQTPHVCWMTGADIVFVDGPLPGSSVLGALEATGATTGVAVPTVWQDLVGHAAEIGATGLGALKKVVLGGAMTPVTLPGRMRDLGVATWIGWGMTETMSSTMALVASPDPHAAVAPDVRTSLPIPGLEARAVDDDGQPTTGPGHLQVRAPWITGEYLGQPPAQGSWFDTGDDGVVGPHGEFTIQGRAKEMIKSGGEAIWPATLEEALLRHPDVVEAAVFEIPHERWGGQPMACVIVRNQATPELLRGFLLESLPKWQVPSAWALHTDLPRTATGKVDKRALAAMVVDTVLVPVHL